MKLQKTVSLVLTAILVAQGSILCAASSYTLSDKVKNIISTEKKVVTDTSKVSFPDVAFYLNGKKVELSAPAMMIEGKTFLPVRALGDALGITVNYAPQHKVAYIITEDVQLELPLYYNKAVKNKTEVLEIEGAKIELYQGKAYLPLRFIGENLGYKVTYKNQKISFDK